METLTSVTDYLLRQSWQIALLVVIVAALSLTLRNRSAHVRYLLWLIVLAKCIVPPLYKVPLAVLPEAEQVQSVPVSPMPEPAVAIETADRPIVEPLMLPRVRVPVPAATKPTEPKQQDRLAQITWQQWLGLGWPAGAALFILVALAKAWRTNRWLRKARRKLPAKLQDRIDDLFAEAGIRNTPKVWLVKGIGQPFVWGLLHGSIYLPANFATTQTAKCRRAVLGHELSHVLRFDAAVNLVQIGAQAVYWFHPLVWWANRKIRAEREKCCDESAIARLNALPKDYSRAIVNTLIVEHKSTRPVPSLAVAGPVKNIEDRIKSIMKSGKRFYRRPTFITIITALLLAAIAVPTTLALTARQQSDPAHLEDVKFRIFDIRGGLPLKHHQLNICRFVHIRLRRGSPSPYLNREASYYIRSVTTDKDGRFSLDISSMNDMDIVVQPVKDHNLVRFERSSDLSHTKSKDHIRVVRLNAETRLVERNMLYDLKRGMVKVITDGKEEEKAFSEVELAVFALPTTLAPTARNKPDELVPLTEESKMEAPNDQALLPGSDLSIEMAMRYPQILFVGVCEALDDASAELGYSGVMNTNQRFKPIESLAGSSAIDNDFNLRYSYLAPNMGFSHHGRTIHKGEQLIWIIVKDGEHLRGIKALADTRKNRRAVLEAVNLPDADTLLEELIERLSGSDVKERAIAVYRLGKMGERAAAAVPHLIPLLRGGSGSFLTVSKRQESSELEVGTMHFGGLFTEEQLRTPCSNVSPVAAEALRKIGRPAVPALIEASKKEEDWAARQRICEVLGDIGDQRALDALLGMMADRDVNVSLKAGAAIRKIDHPDTVDRLIEGLRDQNEYLRQSSAQCLGHIQDPRALDPLIEALKDLDQNVRKNAAEALAQINKPAVIEPLLEASKDESWYVRRWVAWALAKVDDSRIMERLIEILGDENETMLVKVAATRALGEIGGRDAVRVLEQALKNNDPDIREQADKALRNIRQNNSDPDEKMRTANGSAAPVWISLLPRSPIRSAEEIHLYFWSSSLTAGEPNITSFELEIRSAKDNIRMARIDCKNMLVVHTNKGKVLRWQMYRDRLRENMVRRIQPLEDGEYLMAIYVNGVRCSNVGKFTVDSDFDGSTEPTLQLVPLTPAPGKKPELLGLRAVGPKPMDPELTNYALHLPELIVDGVSRKITASSWSGPVYPLRPGQQHEEILRLLGYRPAIDLSREHTVKAIVGKYESASVRIAPDYSLELAWDEATKTLRSRPPLPPALKGKVIGPDGKPAAGYRVCLYMDSDRQHIEYSDRDGKYHFPGVPLGTYQLVCQPQGTWSPKLTFEQFLIRGEEPAVQELSLEGKYTFSGSVIYEDGSPAAGVKIVGRWKKQAGKTVFGDVKLTDDNGRYELAAPFELAERIALSIFTPEGVPAHGSYEHVRVKGPSSDVDFVIKRREAHADIWPKELARKGDDHPNFQPVSVPQGWDRTRLLQALHQYFRAEGDAKLPGSSVSLKDDVIELAFKTRKYNIIRPGNAVTTGIQRGNDRRIGPLPNGLILTVTLSETASRYSLPQLIDRSPWTGFFTEVHLPDVKLYLVADIQYGTRISRQLLNSLCAPTHWLKTIFSTLDKNAPREAKGTLLPGSEVFIETAMANAHTEVMVVRSCMTLEQSVAEEIRSGSEPVETSSRKCQAYRCDGEALLEILRRGLEGGRIVQLVKRLLWVALGGGLAEGGEGWGSSLEDDTGGASGSYVEATIDGHGSYRLDVKGSTAILELEHTLSWTVSSRRNSIAGEGAILFKGDIQAGQALAFICQAHELEDHEVSHLAVWQAVEVPQELSARIRSITSAKEWIENGLNGALEMVNSNTPGAAPVAAGRHEKPEFSATLANGVTVELLGLCEHPSEGKQWWRPDGAYYRILHDDEIKGTVVSSRDPQTIQVFEFGLRATEFDDDYAMVHCTVPQAVRTTQSPKVPKGNSNIVQSVVSEIPKNLMQCDIRVKVAAGTWQTISQSIAHIAEKLMHKSRAGVVQWSPASESEGKTHLLVRHSLAGDFDVRIVAEAQGGSILEPRSCGSEGSSDMLSTTATFQASLANITAFHFQVRPFETAQFRNVSLRRGVETDVEVEVAWGQAGEVEGDQASMNARDVLQAFMENLAAGDYEQASHFTRAAALSEQFRTEFERLSGRKDLRINYITADSGSALAFSSRVKNAVGPENRLIFHMLRDDDIWRVVNIDLKSDHGPAPVVGEFFKSHPDARMIPEGFKGPLELPPTLLAERNRLLSQADAEIRKGIIELANRFPNLTKSRDWRRFKPQKPGPGRISIRLTHSHGFKGSSPQPVPESDRYGVSVFVKSPPAQPEQLVLWSLYPNLRLVGQIVTGAGDPELEAALKKIVDDALAPLAQLNDSAGPDNLGGGGKAVEPIDATRSGQVRQGDELAVNGRVLDRAGGKTVSGVKVKLWSGWTHHSRLAVTDENGHYRFDHIEPGPYMLRVVDLPAGIWTEGTAILATDEPRHRNMRSTRLFRPRAYASSRLCEIGPDQTNAQHSFEAAVITPSRHQANDLYLELPQSVSGIVRNEQTGESVADAKLRFRSLDRLLHSVQTDSEGRYRLFVPPGTDSISCSGTANRYYQSEVGCKIAVRPGEHLEKVDFAVRSAPSFTGRVFSNGSPAPEGTDVWIILEWRDKSFREPFLAKPRGKVSTNDTVQRVKTDTDGQFKGFFRDPYWPESMLYMDVSVTAFAWLPDNSAGGVARSPVTETEKPSIEPLEIVLEDTGSAAFRVVGPDGKGVTDADVDCGRLVKDNPWILGPSVTVTESGQGRYHAKGLIPGLEYRCYVKAEGYRHEGLRYAEPVVVQPGQHVQAADVKLDWWGAKAIPEMIKYIRPTDEGIPHNLGKIGPDAAETVPALVELIKKSDSDTVLFRTTQALGKIGVKSEDTVRVLISLLERKSEGNLIANAAAEALGRLGAQEAVGPIEAALKAGRIWRRTAVTALWRIKKAAKAGAKPSSVSDETAWADTTEPKGNDVHENSGLGKTDFSDDYSDPAVAFIIQKVLNRYASVTTYSDTGETLIDVNTSGLDMSNLPGMTPEIVRSLEETKAYQQQGQGTLRNTFSIKLARPNLYCIEWVQNADTDLSQIGNAWSVGDGSHALFLGQEKSFKDQERALSTASGAGSGAGNIPAVFLDTSSNELRQLRRLRQHDDEEIEGEQCYVISGKRFDNTITFWISRKDFLIRQRREVSKGAGKPVVIPSKEHLKEGLELAGEEVDIEVMRRMQESMKATLSNMPDITTTEIHRNIIVDQPIPKERFVPQVDAAAVTEELQRHRNNLRKAKEFLRTLPAEDPAVEPKLSDDQLVSMREATEAQVEQFLTDLESETQTDAKQAAWGEAVDGLQFGLVCESGKRAFNLGESVSFVFKLRNVSDQPIELQYVKPHLPNWTPTIRNDSGDAAVVLPPFKVPENMSGGFGFGGGTVITKTLKPAEQIDLDRTALTIQAVGWQGPIDQTTVLAEPGKYKLSHTLVLSPPHGGRGEHLWRGKVTSGELELQILPTEQHAAAETSASDQDIETALGLLGEYVSGRLFAASVGSADGDDWTARRAHWEKRCELIGPGAIEHLSHIAAEYPDHGYRVAACEALGETDKPRAAELVAGLLGDNVPLVRLKAARALGHLRSQEHIPELLKSLASDPDSGVRAGAGYALGHIASDRATVGLLKALGSEKDDQVRTAITLAIGWITDPAALPALKTMLAKENDAEQRTRLMNVIRNIEDPDYWGLGVKRGVPERDKHKLTPNTEAHEQPWGEPVEGVQCRLRAEKTIWKSGESPTFKFDMRNLGSRDLVTWQHQQECELELDSLWNRWNRGAHDYMSSAFGPGAEYSDMELSLAGRWFTKQWVPLKLTTGRHVVRVAFDAVPATNSGGERVRAISNPVEIEVLPADTRSVSAEKLKRLGRVLLVYANDDERGGYPDTLRQLLKGDYINLEDFRWFDENLAYLSKGKTAMDRPGLPLACDKTLLAKGNGTNVLYNDGHVGFAGAEEFERLGIGDAEVRSEAEPEETRASERVTLRLIGPDGNAVAAAKVGSMVDWSSTGEAGQGARVYLAGSISAAVSGEDGMVVLEAESLFGSRPVGQGVPIFAYQEDSRLGGLIEVSPRYFGEQVELRLQPLCHVKGRLTSSDLKELGSALAWTNVYARWHQLRPFRCSSDSQRFEFHLPPGQYKLHAYGMHTYNSEVDLDIKPGQDALDLEIDLPADRLAGLIGKPAPELRQIKGWKNGKATSLEDLRGKVVLLDFWGYWCGPCIHQMPKLMELHDAFSDKGLVIIAVHDDSVGSIEQMDARLEKARERYWGGRDLPFLVALDGGGSTRIEGTDKTTQGATTAAYGIMSFPTTVLIDTGGNVVGKVSAYNVEEKIKEMVGAKAPVPAWRERFDEVYRLDDGQILKRIAPPFIPERAEYYRHEHSGQASAIAEPPDYFTFHWDAALVNWGLGFTGGERPLEAVLKHNLSMGRDAFEGPEELLEIDVQGDWIVRKDSSMEQRLEALEKILEDETGRGIRFIKRRIEREVIVAGGRYRFRGLPGKGRNDVVYMYSDIFDIDSGGGGGTAKSVSEFLAALANRVGVPVIDRTESSGDNTIVYDHHRSSYLGKVTDELERAKKLEMLLANLTKQTDLQFKISAEPVEIWFVTEQAVIEAQPPSGVPEEFGDRDVAMTSGTDGFASGEVVDAGSDTAGLYGGSEICGRVTDEQGKPIAGAGVRLVNNTLLLPSEPEQIGPHKRLVLSNQGSTSTDREGQFTLTVLKPGRTDVVIRAQDYRTQILTDIATGTTNLNVVLGRPTAYTLAGEVVDGRGEPIAGAEVTSADAEKSYTTVVTDQRGAFRFLGELQPTTSHATRSLFVTKGGFGVSGKILDTTGGQRYVRIRLLPEKQVVGRALDGAGQPIAGALVYLWACEGKETEFHYTTRWQEIAPKTTTDADGKYVFSGMPDDSIISLHAEAEGYAHGRVFGIQTGQFSGYAHRTEHGTTMLSPLSFAAGQEVEFRLQQAAILMGTVVYEDSSAPAAGVRVGVQSHGGWSEANTDEAGRFELTSVDPKPCNVLAMDTAPEWTAAAIEIESLDPGRTRDDLKLVLTKGVVVQGRAVDADGRGLRGIDIAFYSAARPRSGAACQHTNTADDGSWFYRFPPGEVYVYVRTRIPDCQWSKKDYTFDVAAGQVLESIDFQLNDSIPQNSPYLGKPDKKGADTAGVREQIGARHVVESFIAAAAAGEFVEAEKFARPGSAVREQIAELWELEGGRDIKTVDVYGDTAEALAVSSPIKPDSEKADVLVFHLVNENQAWLIDALEHRAKDKAQTMLAEFRREHPKAKLIPEETNEPAWGEAVNGLQCRLQPNKSVHRQDEIPACKIDLRHIGADKGVQWAGYREKLEIEVDGLWYRSRVETSSPPFELTPDRPVSEATVDLEYYHRGHAVWTNEEGYALDLGPGRHVMRARMTVLYGRPIDSDVEKVSLVSNPVKIEISVLPERVVHFPKDRSMGKLHVQPWRWELNSDVIMWEELGQAQDAVVVPAGKQLWLQISEEAAKDLSPLTSLRPGDLYMLGLYGDVTDEQLGQIKGLTGLRELFFHEGQIKDEQLAHLKALKGLWTLNLFGKDITNAGLVHLEDIKSLKFAYLGRTQVTMDGIKRLQKALPDCVIKHTLSRQERMAGGELVKLNDSQEQEIQAIINEFWVAIDEGDFEAVREFARQDQLEQHDSWRQMLAQANEERKKLLSRGVDIAKVEQSRIVGNEVLAIAGANRDRFQWYYLQNDPSTWKIRLFDDTPKTLSWDELLLKCRSVNKLSVLREVLRRYRDEHNEEYPTALGQVEPYVHQNEDLKWLRQNVEYVGTEKDPPPSQPTILAYTKTLISKDENTSVLYSNGLISFLPTSHILGTVPAAQSRNEPNDTWGQPVEGVQVRLRPNRDHWKATQTPSFSLDLRNVGDKVFSYSSRSAHSSSCQIILDGERYIWRGPTEGGLPRAPRRIKPGHVFIRAFGVTLNKGWQATASREPLHLATGSHTVQVAFAPKAGARNLQRGAELLSNPVRINVLPDGAKETPWSEAVAVDGLEVQLQAKKLVWTTVQTPAFIVNAHNPGSAKRLAPLSPLSYSLHIDGTAYHHRDALGKALPYVDLGPGQATTGIDISMGRYVKSWRDRRGPALAPGRHTIQVGFPFGLAKGQQSLSNPAEIEIIQADAKSTSAAKLRELGQALLQCITDYEHGSYPDTLQALQDADHISQQDGQWWLKNVEYLGKGKTVPELPRVVIAYDRTLLLETHEGTNVLFNDSYVAFVERPELVRLGIVKTSEGQLGIGRGPRTLEVNKQLETTIDVSARGPADTRHRFAIFLVAEPVDVGKPEKVNIGQLRLASTPVLTERDIVEYDWDKHVLKLTPEAKKRMPGPKTVWPLPFVVVADGQRCYLGAFWSIYSSYMPEIPHIDSFFPGRPANEIEIGPAPGDGGTDLRSDPRINKVLQQLGLIRETKQYLESQEKLYQEKTAAEPNNPEAWAQLGKTRLKLGKYAAAKEVFESCLKLDSEHVAALEGLGQTLEQMGRVDEAIARYQKAIETFTRLWTDASPDVRYSPKGKPSPSAAPTPLDMLAHAACRLAAFYAERCEYELALKYLQGLPGCRDEAVKAKVDGLRRALDYAERLGWGKASNGLQIRLVVPIAEREQMPRPAADKLDAWLEVRNVSDEPLKLVERNIPPLSYISRAEDRDWLVGLHINVRSEGQPMRLFSRAYDKKYRWSHVGGAGGIFTGRIEPGGTSRFRIRLRRLEHDGMNLLSLRGPCELQAVLHIEEVSSTFWHGKAVGASVPVMIGQNKDEVIDSIESARKLRQLGQAILDYSNANYDKYPDSLEQLREDDYIGQADWQWLIENVQYLGKGKNAANLPDVILAYDRSLLLQTQGGTNVLFNDSHVAFSNNSELEQLGIIRVAKGEPGMALSPRTLDINKQLQTVVDLSHWRPKMAFAEALDDLSNAVAPPLSIVVMWGDLADNAGIDRTTSIGEGIRGTRALSTIRLRAALEVLLALVSVGG
ncbi:MAG: HEAT repeat domain-containing protein, partial [Planctomycetota bacterium]